MSGGFVGVNGLIPIVARQLAAPFVPGDVIEKTQLFCGILTILSALVRNNMLTGNVVADGEYVALLELFEEHDGVCVFSGSLTRTHEQGESVLPISFRLTTPDEDDKPDLICETRKQLGWEQELVSCSHATCSIASIGLQDIPVLAAIDVDADDQLRLLIVSAKAPLLGEGEAKHLLLPT